MTLETKIAEATALVPRKILFGNPEKTAPAISGDGKYLAYLAPDKNNVMNVWVCTTGSNDDRMVTSDNDRGIRIYFWRQDHKHLIYMQDEKGEENWHVFQTDVETGDTKDLTPFSGANSYVLATNPKYPDEILIGSNKRDERLMDVYRVNFNNGKITEDTLNPGDVAGFICDHDLRVRIAHVMRPDGSILLRIRDDEASPWRELTSWGADESRGGVAGFTPDNRNIYLISSVGANAARLVELTVADGTQKVIAEDKQFDLSQLSIHPTEHYIQAVNFNREKSEWTALEESVRADFDFLNKSCRGSFYITGRTLADDFWIICDVVDNGSVRFYSYDRSKKALELIFSAQPELDNYTLSSMQAVSYTARDGLKIYGYLTMPPGLSADQTEKPPLVLLVHGGPWGRNLWGFDGEAQWLANRGYAVLQINFRGSTGYGKDFYNAGDREWGAKMNDDLIDGKRWAIAQELVDPDKVAIFGASYGGYATLVGLAFTPDEFVCGVDVFGPSNLVTLLSSFPPYWEAEKALFTKRVGNVETEKDFLESRSPVFKADQIKAPLLIAQGAQDARVKQAESDQIVEAMRKNGKEVEYLLIEDEGHGFAKPENRLRFYTLAEDFLAKHLGGRKETE